MVTTQRVIERKGLLSKIVYEVKTKDIKNINLLQSPLECLVGVGTLELSSAGGADVEVILRRITASETVRTLIRRFQ